MEPLRHHILCLAFEGEVPFQTLVVEASDRATSWQTVVVGEVD